MSPHRLMGQLGQTELAEGSVALPLAALTPALLERHPCLRYTSGREQWRVSDAPGKNLTRSCAPRQLLFLGQQRFITPPALPIASRLLQFAQSSCWAVAVYV